MNARFASTNGILLGVALLAAAFLYLMNYPLWHTDIWAHTKYGETYCEQGFFHHEPLSPFTDHEAKFAHVAWLSQVVYDAIYRLGASWNRSSPETELHGGAEALRLFHFALLMARFILIWLTFRRFGGSNGWAAVCLFLYIMAVGIGSAIQRPQAFGLLYMTILLFALSAPKLGRRWLIGLPLIFALWTNMHGTFTVGLAVLGLHTVGRAIERGLFDSEVKLLVFVGILCGLATFINPHGPLLYREIIAFSGHPNLKTMTEWHPMRFSFGGGSHWPYLMSLLLLGMIWTIGSRSVGAAGWLVALPFALWPWWQERALLWWWPLAMWLLARIGPGLAEALPTLPKLPEGEPSKRKSAIIIGIITGCVLAMLVTQRQGGPDTTVSAGTPWRFALELKANPEQHGYYLPELRKVIDSRYPNGQFSGVIFSSETQGDFLVWALPKSMPVTLFTHAHVFGKVHWDKCLDIKSADPNPLELLDELNAELIIVESDTHAELCRLVRESNKWNVIIDEIPPPHPPGDMRHERFIAIRR